MHLFYGVLLLVHVADGRGEKSPDVTLRKIALLPLVIEWLRQRTQHVDKGTGPSSLHPDLYCI